MRERERERVNIILTILLVFSGLLAIGGACGDVDERFELLLLFNDNNESDSACANGGLIIGNV
jgi:hypothetical protein